MSNLKIAIQKSGRLNEDSINLLKDCGINIEYGKSQLRAIAHNFPLEILYLRNNDIPQYLVDGVVDIAIIGENTIVESNSTLKIIEKLGFSKCRLSIAVPKNQAFQSIKDFEGKRIATSYPNSLNRFLSENKINAELHNISGSVEIAPNIGLADAICDLVSSGGTLFANNLKEVAVIVQSEAVLTVSPSINDDKQKILDKLLIRVQAVLKGRNFKYLLLNAPNDKIDEIKKLLPGMKSPTILPLAEEGWSSVHTVVEKHKFWEVIDQLKEIGAQGILIVPIEKMVL